MSENEKKLATKSNAMSDADKASAEEKNKSLEEKGQHDKAQKRPAEKLSDVHSANDWEHAELGDADRKNKFLRLMGAGKKDHHGKIIIGDQQPSHVHGRSDSETQKLTENLEGQFKQSLEHKLSGGARRHKGLGFSSEEEKKKEEEEKKQAEEKEDTEHKKTQEAGDKPQEQKDTPSEKETTSETPKAKKLGISMNFVKASS